MKKYKIIYSKASLESIKNIISFISNVSLEASKKEFLHIKETISNLEFFPKRFPVLKGIMLFDKEVHKLVTKNGRYVIIYEIFESTVFINDIIDSRSDSILFNDLANNQD